MCTYKFSIGGLIGVHLSSIVYWSYQGNFKRIYFICFFFFLFFIFLGFWSAISGTIEHTELLTHIIKHTENKQRQIIIALLDLKNGFGEVDSSIVYWGYQDNFKPVYFFWQKDFACTKTRHTLEVYACVKNLLPLLFSASLFLFC